MKEGVNEDRGSIQSESLGELLDSPGDLNGCQGDEATLAESSQAEPTDLRGIYGALEINILLLFVPLFNSSDVSVCSTSYSHTPAH